jgi:hypothetical protein
MSTLAMKLFHASLSDSIKSFNDNSHFADGADPALTVIAWKLFCDTDDGQYKISIPSLYTCNAALDGGYGLDIYPDLKSPNIQTLFNAWFARKQKAREKADNYEAMDWSARKAYNLKQLKDDMAIRSAFLDLDETGKVAWLKAQFQNNGWIGYRYDNEIEGGASIRLLDASVVTIVRQELVERVDLASRFLKIPLEKYKWMGVGERFELSVKRAKNVLANRSQDA